MLPPPYLTVESVLLVMYSVGFASDVWNYSHQDSVCFLSDFDTNLSHIFGRVSVFFCLFFVAKFIETRAFFYIIKIKSLSL